MAYPVEKVGFEPTTVCLQGRCSTVGATSPEGRSSLGVTVPAQFVGPVRSGEEQGQVSNLLVRVVRGVDRTTLDPRATRHTRPRS